MKNKIIKLLEKPKIVITITLFLAIIIGIWVYKNVGVAPVVLTNDLPKEIVSADGKEINLAFPKNGRVKEVEVKEGDVVKAGQLLASLDFSDVKGSLDIAKANYEKVLNGATGADIDVAKATVDTAQVSLDQAKIQQDTLVKNAKKNLLNSGFILTTDDNQSVENPPIVSGTYLKEAEGQIIIEEYDSSGGVSFKTTGLVETSGMASTQIPQPIGDTGLYIKYSNLNNRTKWILDIPNKQSASYTQNLNAYQNALTTQSQVLANSTALLNQAKKALVLKQTSARPEDVVSASGALQIAQSAYDNAFIYAPSDGVITAVNLNKGETVLANQKVIKMISKIIK